MGQGLVFLLLFCFSILSSAGTELFYYDKTFKISEDTQSFLIQAIQKDQGNQLFIFELVSPDGQVLIQSNLAHSQVMGIPAYLLSEIRSPLRATMAAPGQIATIVSKSESLPEISGEWTVRFASDQQDSLNLKVLETKQQKKRTLMFNLYFNKNALNYNKENLLKLTSKVSKFYAQYKISISFKVHGVELPEKVDMTIEEWFEKNLDFSKKYRPIFLFDTRTLGDHKALSDCLPGFESEDKKARCPIAMSLTEEGVVGSNKTVKVLAHEIGHYLGLFHPCDDLGFAKVCDRLTDTEDNPESINLMNTLSTDNDSFELSLQQVIKIKNHPLLFKH